ncbi:hypothetical protein L249_7115 [Ophiocordyceps polyrhachis-furcata BCC 54312]|uniref:Uncharacterized protein n=1 Tax=Ophiocordyceps polyrhachis-furcata BCC 54312 TaxID=1330021 RepID=A0A367LKU6_9HYPO|nr:hypothetical protein L249_7115 [Ophiocordyceps polyrhachis-furcata BCC 54312]
MDHVIEKKKTNHVIKIGDLEEDFNVMDQPDDLTLVRPSRSGAMTAIVQRADRCDGCLVPRSIGCYDRYSPTVTQGVVAGLRPNWYNLF